MSDTSDEPAAGESVNRQTLLEITTERASTLEQTEQAVRDTAPASEPEPNTSVQSKSNRRLVLKKAAGAVAALTIGTSAIAGTTTAETDSVELTDFDHALDVADLDLKPRVPAETKAALDVKAATDEEIEAFQGACSGALVCHRVGKSEITLCVSSEGRAAHLIYHDRDTPGRCR